jgi:hypothetical protein
MSGPPGTTFVQWGTGFSANGTATLHFKKPDGAEEPPLKVQLDANGHFEIPYESPWNKPAGTYTWWGVDNKTGKISNHVSYTIENPSASALSGKVYDLKTGKVVPGAEVKVGSRSAISDSTGAYSIPSVPSGQYTARVSKSGYALLSEPLAVPQGSTVRQDFTLAPEGMGLCVTGVYSKYYGHSFFLDGLDHNVAQVANVNWAGKAPGKVRFTTPKGTYDVATTTDKASKVFNMGEEFGPCGTLRVKAIAADGTPSPEFTADLTVMSNPFDVFAPLFLFAEGGPEFSYNVSGGINPRFFKGGVDAGTIPKDIPLFGGEAFGLDFIPKLSAEVDSSGKAKLAFDWGDAEVCKIFEKEYGSKHDLKKISELLERYKQMGKIDKRWFPQASFGGFDFLIYPYVSANGEYSEAHCAWDWGGSFKIAIGFEGSRTWPAIFMAGPVPVPVYGKLASSVTFDVGGELLQLEPFEGQMLFNLDPKVRGSLGVGVDSVFAVEGWVGGGAEYEYRLDGSSNSWDIGVFINGGASVYSLLFNFEAEALRYEWHTDGVAGRVRTALPEMGPVTPKLVARDYLSRGSYARFAGGVDAREKTVMKNGLSTPTTLAAVETSIFPYSEPVMAAGGSRLHLAWLTDNAARSDINRTLAVSSVYNGTAWSTPVAIEDDGTPDFHPDLLAFSNGAVFAAWEDGKSVLPDTATFEDMAASLDISVARFNPTTGAWGAARKLTNNVTLDRSPRISGAASNKLLLTWIANIANDLRGSDAKPNTLRFSTFDGTSWAPAGNARQVPYGIIQYDLLYDGVKGHAVFSLDTDHDPKTVDDRELFRMVYASGAWGALQRLTTNSVPDDNPRLAVTPDGGVLLTWLKKGKLQSVENFNFSAPVTVLADEYSSNLADYRLCSTANGRVALTWVEPSGYASDIHAVFYDPVFNVWGSPKKLTDDPEIERALAPAFYGEKMLTVVYNRTAVSVQEQTHTTLTGKEVVVATPIPVSTDLYMVQLKAAGDLALESETFVTTPINPSPGEPLTLKATVVNNGELAAKDFEVAFYAGDPAQGGPEIGRKRVSQVLKPGASTGVELTWKLPASPPARISAVVDPEGTLEDRNRANNKVKRSTTLPDLAVGTMSFDKLTDSLVGVKARVVNLGSVASTETNVRFRKNSTTGAILSTQAVPVLDPGESYEALIRVNPENFAEGDMVIHAVVDEGKTVPEYDETNNAGYVVIERN